MARISFPTPETMTAEQRQIYDAIVSGPRGRLVGPLKAALHNPALADQWQKLGALLRFGTSIPPRFSELAILVTARRWNSQVEWYIHAVAAQKAGLPDTVIEAIRNAQAPEFDNEDDLAVYEFARQMQQSAQVADSVYRHVQDKWQDVGVVDLTAIIGYYTMVSMTLNAHEIPLPDENVPPPLSPVATDGDSKGAQAEQGPGLTTLPPARSKISVKNQLVCGVKQ